MKTLFSAVSLALATAIPFAADASELKPMEAGTYLLGNQSVSIYYTASGETYQVVATVAPEAGATGSPIRFVGFLQPGQKALVSTGHFGSTAEPHTLQLVHDGDALLASTITSVATAN